jgi:hypothetical protein
MAEAASFVDGAKLISFVSGAAQFGYTVALSFDGSTAIVGAPYDGSSDGSARVFVRSGGAWIPQGSVFRGTTSSADQLGRSVALSADGNTAVVGAPGSGSSVSVFTRSGGTWFVAPTVTGAGSWGSTNLVYVALSGDGLTLLVGTPGLSAAWAFTRSGNTFSYQGELAVPGWSVALSSDGNTALVGDPGDSAGVGAAWVYTRSAGTWTQRKKLVGTGNVGASGQGNAVALSSDGSTALVGGPGDNTGIGAAWVFTGSGSTWTQQGSKLVGTGGTRPSYEDQGVSVALSADGNTALLGASGEDGGGAAWAFARMGGAWSQLGDKLVGFGPVGPAQERGFSVALAGDGKTAFVGGPYDANQTGAVWIFPRLCVAAGDVDGNGASDVSDVFYLINYLFAGGPAPACF